ncbi:lytic transglycosylase domain-containing protein [Methylobacterium sp. NEAU 140]|uniref:lytic transglycosylase domain-containing protein n=1 Tax=Methylobacterium sp. NEAU 140 TaxID=3064945 RepID=UPI002734DBEC|nr:lytic transglycosylase domain-containing protein [Methylobacterium sp. NEAU 140]MDP4025798.1 lytic transglycosylase domain-containing protein [Methylobacterium sp. NEAU 140]
MFLFTTPSSPSENPAAAARPVPGPAAGPGAGQAAGPVVQAIRDGASASGVGFDYLLATARRESALDPAAKAGTSTATGLFQFIEQTWLGVMKSAGPRLGLAEQAEAITRQADGTYTVPDADRRQAILDLRRDPRISATLAGALTQKNAEALTGALGREPTAGDLYAAHVLGAKGAAALIGTARTFPERAAALDLPEAAAANRGLFYDRTGRPRTAAELYANLSAAAQGVSATDLTGLRQEAPSPPRAATAYAAAATATAAANGAGTATGTATATGFGGSADLRSLFQTESRGAVSDAAARLWQGRSTPPAPERPAPTWFPRSGAAAAEDGPANTGALPAAAPPPAAPAAIPPGTALANPPLPPRRPADLATAPDAGAPKTIPHKTSLFAPRSGP